MKHLQSTVIKGKEGSLWAVKGLLEQHPECKLKMYVGIDLFSKKTL